MKRKERQLITGILFFMLALCMALPVHAAALRMLDLGPMADKQKVGGYVITAKWKSGFMYLCSGKTEKSQKYLDKMEQKDIQWWHIYVATDGKKLYYFSEQNSDKNAVLKSISLDGKNKTTLCTVIKDPLIANVKGSKIYFGRCRSWQSYLDNCSPVFAFNINNKKLTVSKDGYGVFPGKKKKEITVTFYSKSLKGMSRSYTVKTSLNKPNSAILDKSKKYLYFTVTTGTDDNYSVSLYRFPLHGKSAPVKILTLPKNCYPSEVSDKYFYYMDEDLNRFKYVIASKKTVRVDSN